VLFRFLKNPCPKICGGDFISKNMSGKNSAGFKKGGKNETAINSDIREAQVRLIGEDGEPIGIVSGKEAQELADKAELDLVMIAPQATPPVCRIMDYGKFRFDQSKREKEGRKNQQQTILKEVRLSLNIDDHDFTTKVNHAKKFLKAGDKVKVTIRFKGREVTHLDLGQKLMERFKQECSEFCTFDEKPSKLEGRFYATVLFPKADKAKPKPKQEENKGENHEE
jgi:translation initiation factor IF-3